MGIIEVTDPKTGKRRRIQYQGQRPTDKEVAALFSSRSAENTPAPSRDFQVSHQRRVGMLQPRGAFVHERPLTGDLYPVTDFDPEAAEVYEGLAPGQRFQVSDPDYPGGWLIARRATPQEETKYGPKFNRRTAFQAGRDAFLDTVFPSSAAGAAGSFATAGLTALVPEVGIPLKFLTGIGAGMAAYQAANALQQGTVRTLNPEYASILERERAKDRSSSPQLQPSARTSRSAIR